MKTVGILLLKEKLHINYISSLCKETIKPDYKIKIISKNIVKRSNTKDKDALHLASAVHDNCEYFITCNDKFIKTIETNRYRLYEIIKNIKLYNPIDFLRKEMNIDVIE